MVAHFVVEGEGNVGRLGSVDVEDAITEVLSRVLPSLVGASLLHEQVGPPVEVVRVFDTRVFEDHVAVLREVVLVPLVVVHLDLFLALRRLESVHVGNSQVLEAGEHILLQFGWPVQGFLALMWNELSLLILLLLFSDFSLPPSIKQRFTEPSLFWHDRSLLIGVFG